MQAFPDACAGGVVRSTGSLLFVSVSIAGLFLIGQQAFGAMLTRGPFVQMVTTNAITIRWRTDVAADSVARFGTSVGNLDQATNSTSLATNHELRLNGLAAATRYYYSVGSSAETLASGDGIWFVTAPIGRQATRVWVIGDSGEPDGARITYQSYTNFTAARATDVWLMLGDNDYSRSTGPTAYQAAVFDTFPELLRQTVLWPSIGNDEYSDNYVATFTLPTRGEAGGVASGTELYYSFDYGDIHFVALDSNNGARTNDPMVLWLQEDLAANTRTWTIAYWHHPPYSHGPHNSDLASKVQQVEMREVVLPVLEDHGVDLVLTGHSHVYERSFLIDGHYGYSTNLQPSMIVDSGNGREDQDGAYEKAGPGPAPHQGTVYAVVGCSSRPLAIGSLDHPVMVTSLVELGSLVLDIDGGRIDGKFVNSSGVVRDYFTLLKHEPPALSIDRTNSQVFISWPRDATGFSLEQNSGLAGAPESWTSVSPPYTTNGARIGVMAPLTTSNGFYRLRK
jgi:hypothetical protein